MPLITSRSDLIVLINTVLIPRYQGDAQIVDALQKASTYLASRRVTAQSTKHARNLRDNAIRYVDGLGHGELAGLIEQVAARIGDVNENVCVHIPN